MRFDDALRQIAADGNLNADALIAFAAEDQIGGRDTGDWPAMSIFADEGKLIYALVRALRPAQVVEVGVASGGGSTHILSALEANNHGQLWSVDLVPDCGLKIPDHLRHRWTFVTGDALTVPLPPRADFCFEDGAHSLDFTSQILTRLKALNPRLIMSHDALTHEVYGEAFQVLNAWKAVLNPHKTLHIEAAFTGLAYWWNANYVAPTELVIATDEEKTLLWVDDTGVKHDIVSPEPRITTRGRPKKHA